MKLVRCFIVCRLSSRCFTLEFVLVVYNIKGNRKGQNGIFNILHHSSIGNINYY